MREKIIEESIQSLEYHTHGPVTKTLIPLAALDDVIGVGWIASRVLRRVQGENGAFALFLLFLCLSTVTGILTDWFLFHA